MATKYNNKTYWAAEPESEDAVQKAVDRIKAYRERLIESSTASRVRRSWRAYIGLGPNGDADSSQLTAGGEVGERLMLNVNQYATIANQIVTLTTSSKPSVKAIASNTDFTSIGAATFAEGLNDYYDRELNIADREIETIRNAVLMGEAWLVQDWDQSEGAAVMIDEQGRPINTGNVKIHALTLFDVARDLNVNKIDDCKWILWRHREGKYDLAAKYPNIADQILDAESDNDQDMRDASYDYFKFDELYSKNLDCDDDTIYVWELRHLPTPALPKGRLIRFINSQVVLFDTFEKVAAHVEMTEQVATDGTVVPVEVQVPEQIFDHGYPYEDQLFAFSAAAERVPGTSFGHTAFFDLLSLQEGINLGASIQGSAINAGGLQNIYVKRGANITANKMVGALNIVEYDGEDGVPVAKDNVSINPAVPNFQSYLLDSMRQRVAINEVVVGDPSAGMPAQAMALLRAQAVESNSGLQTAYEKLIQRSRTGILKLLQMFADHEIVAKIAGKSNSWAVKEFTKKDLAGFDAFVVEPVSPTTKTLAGKLSIAQPLLDAGKITDQQYMQLLSTGRMEPVVKFESDNQARIEREKELLMQGIGLPPFQTNPDGSVVIDPESGLPQFEVSTGTYVRPVITDTFWSEIPEYASVLAMPETRSNAKVVTAVTELIKYCIALWKIQPPAITMTLKGVPAPMNPVGPPPAEPVGSTGVPAPENSPGTPGPVPPGSPEVNMPKPPELKNADERLTAINSVQNEE